MMTQDATQPRNPFSKPRDFLANRLVYLTISPRARGLSVGVNLNPDKQCNFDCVYCEVNRLTPGTPAELDVEAMAGELEAALLRVQSGELHRLPPYDTIPDHLLQLRHVALSGDGEPTLCPRFLEAVHAVLHLRAVSGLPFFKVVLITNASGLDRPEVQEGIRLLTQADEIWAKLDAGTEEYKNRVNRTEIPLARLLENILMTGRQRPIIIQSLFAMVQDAEPGAGEIAAYAERLGELKSRGARIQQVQIYSATRPLWNAECRHLPLRRLSQIAQTVRERTGLNVEVF